MAPQGCRAARKQAAVVPAGSLLRTRLAALWEVTRYAYTGPQAPFELRKTVKSDIFIFPVFTRLF